jgi:anaerobic selenocysteine-containing dehydrogenase
MGEGSDCSGNEKPSIQAAFLKKRGISTTLGSMPKKKYTFCRICEAVCGLIVEVENNRIVNISLNHRQLGSRGFACKDNRRDVSRSGGRPLGLGTFQRERTLHRKKDRRGKHKCSYPFRA